MSEVPEERELRIATFDRYGPIGSHPATDADLAKFGYYRLDVDVAQIREGMDRYRHDDHLSAALLWARLVAQVLAAAESESPA